MGAYINIGNSGLKSARNGEYVDKSGLIAIVNGSLFTERRFSCVSRSRRFGKSLAAKMLCAYYDRSCDSRHLFADLEIAGDPSFEKHLNKYPVQPIQAEKTHHGSGPIRRQPAAGRHQLRQTAEAPLLPDRAWLNNCQEYHLT